MKHIQQTQHTPSGEDAGRVGRGNALVYVGVGGGEGGVDEGGSWRLPGGAMGRLGHVAGGVLPAVRDVLS
jgi:hypothetical protein